MLAPKHTYKGATPPTFPQDGDIERFIAAFNTYEDTADLFDRCRDAQGFAWWDLVRYAVRFSICVEKGIIGARQTPPRSMFKRTLNGLRQSVRLARDAVRIVQFGRLNISCIHISTRPTNDILVAQVQAEAVKDGQSPSPVLHVNTIGAVTAPDVAIKKQSVDFFIRLVAPFLPLPPKVDRHAADVAAQIKHQFQTAVDVRAIIAARYRHHLAAWLVWGALLSRLKTMRRIVFVNDDTLKTLVHLANAKGIETIEMQHGYMGRSHIGFSYPPLHTLPDTLAQKVWITHDTDDIVYPVPKVTVRMPDKHAVWGQPARDIDVLIGGSPTRAKDTRDIIAALVDLGLSIGVKLHPAQNQGAFDQSRAFTSQQVTIHPGHGDFNALARRARIYVPANPTSTTVFEAVEAGAALIVVDYDGRKMTSMIDNIVTQRVGSCPALRDAVLCYLRKNGTDAPFLMSGAKQ